MLSWKNTTSLLGEPGGLFKNFLEQIVYNLWYHYQKYEYVMLQDSFHQMQYGMLRDNLAVFASLQCIVSV